MASLADDRGELGAQPDRRAGKLISSQNRDAHLVALLLVLSILFGGGTRAGFLGDAALQLISAPILAYAVFVVSWRSATRLERMALLLAAAVAVLFLVQLLPLPPAI